MCWATTARRMGQTIYKQGKWPLSNREIAWYEVSCHGSHCIYLTLTFSDELYLIHLLVGCWYAPNTETVRVRPDHNNIESLRTRKLLF